MSKKSDAVKKWRKATKARIVAAMGGKCQCCGYDRCNESMDLHHVDPTQKEMSFGSIRANPRKWEIIVAELKKCILVCRNCHGEIRQGIRSIPLDYQRFDESYTEYRIVAEQLTDSCPICNESKPTDHQFCSLSCAGIARRRVDWDVIPLLEMLKTRTARSVAEELGVSDAAVHKRRKKLAAREGVEPPCTL